MAWWRIALVIVECWLATNVLAIWAICRLTSGRNP